VTQLCCFGSCSTPAKEIIKLTGYHLQENYIKHNLFGLEFQEYLIVRFTLLLSHVMRSMKGIEKSLNSIYFRGSFANLIWHVILKSSGDSELDSWQSRPYVCSKKQLMKNQKKHLDKCLFANSGLSLINAIPFSMGMESLRTMCSGIHHYENTFFPKCEMCRVSAYVFSIETIPLNIIDFGSSNLSVTNNLYVYLLSFMKNKESTHQLH